MNGNPAERGWLFPGILPVNLPTTLRRQVSGRYAVMGLHFLMLYHCFGVWFGTLSGVSIEKMLMGACLCAAGLLFFAGFLFEIRERTLLRFSPIIRVLFAFIILWGLFVIVRGLSMNFSDLRTMFGTRTGAWSWLVPIVMVVGARRSNWRILTDAFALHITMGVFLSILFLGLFRSKATNFASWDAGMFYATSFFLLTWSYHTKALKVLSLLGFMLFFISNLAIASRTNVAGCLCYMICFVVIYVSLYRQNRVRSTVHPFVLVLVGIIILGIAYPALSSLQSFRTIKDRFERKLFDDTRSHVVNDLFASQVGWERLIGKGALGTTWSSYFYSYRFEKGGDDPERLNIEPGYLQIIFKGGYVMLALFLAMTIPAGILGVFCSKNLLTRACGLIILVNLGGMVVSWPPLMRPPYVLFWLSVGACLSERIRMATDVELLGQEEFN